MTTIYINETLSSDGADASVTTANTTIDSPKSAIIIPTNSVVGRFFRKYFLEGQRLNDDSLLQAKKCLLNDPPLPFHQRHRKLIGFLIPFTFMHTVWWILAIRYNIFSLYPTRWQLPLTMVLGATVAGATSEGGGAVAFPVMTLLLKIEPKVARDFSLMIQSCGMTSAAFTILWMNLRLEWNAIVLSTIGSTIGITCGLSFFDDVLNAAEKKMLFVAIWFSFALSLFILNTQKKRTTYLSVQRMNVGKGGVLLVAGVVGGLFSAFAGSGVDICSFSILTLLFRVNEKVATPTSVVLMAVNTCVGFFWRQLIMNGISELAWEYFEVSVPVVVICAPMGALLSSHFHRLTLACFVYLLEIMAVIGFLLTRPDWELIAVGGGIVFVSFGFFLIISHIGKHLHKELVVVEPHQLVGEEKKKVSSAG